MDFFTSTFASGPLAFLALIALFYCASICVLFATGLIMTWVNSRHPERKIQQRDPTHDAARDIRSSMFQLLITSICLAIGMFAQVNGWTFVSSAALSWWSVPLFFVLSLLLHDAWFYWGHRLLHTKWFYRFYKPHHMTVTPTVWSNDAGSSVDTLFAHSYYALVLFVVPIPPMVLLGHRLFDQVSAAIGHCGFEHFASPTARKPWPMLCTLYHDQHHQYFVYNYSNYFSFWDRLCGTIHPSCDERVAGFEDLYAAEQDKS